MLKHKKTIKKYVIHILAINAIKEDTFDLPKEKNAIIVCTNQHSKFIDLCKKENILIVDFPDIRDRKNPFAFNFNHARKIIDFISNLADDVSDMYVCCSKGESRSAAVAAVLLKISDRSDRDVWLNPYYVPNDHVYFRICREFGIHISRFSVWCLVSDSNQ